ncbi:protein enabled homolog [Exaiptasia diaphana]|uniref:Uncharacterized protein n=1 Tax=Exaiptasia diaphana TaxID=2652724 RepID=A0A913YND1_EXADI|nr:protein enabled homolog [Exaiptasia diaphana]
MADDTPSVEEQAASQQRFINLVHFLGLIEDREGFREWYQFWREIAPMDPDEMSLEDRMVYLYTQQLWDDLQDILENYEDQFRDLVENFEKMGLIDDRDAFEQEHYRILELHRKYDAGEATPQEVEERRALMEKHVSVLNRYIEQRDPDQASRQEPIRSDPDAFLRRLFRNMTELEEVYRERFPGLVEVLDTLGLLSDREEFEREHDRLMELDDKDTLSTEEQEEQTALKEKHRSILQRYLEQRPQRTSTPVEGPSPGLIEEFESILSGLPLDDLEEGVDQELPPEVDSVITSFLDQGDQKQEDLVSQAMGLADLSLSSGPSTPRPPPLPSSPPPSSPPLPPSSPPSTPRRRPRTTTNPTRAPYKPRTMTPPPFSLSSSSSSSSNGSDEAERLEREIEKLENRLYTGKNSFREVVRIQDKITRLEEQLARLNQSTSRPSDRLRRSVRRRGSDQEVVSATTRQNLGAGDHRTTTTTRTTTTVRKGRKPVVERSSRSVSAPLSSSPAGSPSRNSRSSSSSRNSRGSGKKQKTSINALIEHMRKKYKRSGKRRI